MKRIILDTNIIIAGLMSRRGASYKLLSLVGEHHFESVVSVPLVLEYESVMKRLSGNRIKLSHQTIDDIIDYLCHVAIHQRIYYLWRPVLKDAGDDHVLEVAMNASAEAIITFNTNDFKNAFQHNIRIINPGVFLKEIGEF